MHVRQLYHWAVSSTLLSLFLLSDRVLLSFPYRPWTCNSPTSDYQVIWIIGLKHQIYLIFNIYLVCVCISAHMFHSTYVKINKQGLERWLRVFTALPEDLNLVPNTLFWSLQAPALICTYWHKYRHIHVIKNKHNP